MNAFNTEDDDEIRLTVVWQWLCKTQKNTPANADIWDLWFHWPKEQSGLLAQLQVGTYQFMPMQVVGKVGHVMWSARDALALKWETLGLEGQLPLHKTCVHVRGVIPPFYLFHSRSSRGTTRATHVGVSATMENLGGDEL